MLKLKNAQPLSRTEMKNLMGGTNDEAAKAFCPNSCFMDEQTGERSCAGGEPCQTYLCNPTRPIYGYRCP
jgi:natural product precursor